MPVPQSLLRAGFLPPSSLRPANRKRRLMIGAEGPPDSGKTEFGLSIPGPGIAICIDRGIDPIFDNPHPPKSRRDDWAFKVLTPPMETGGTHEEFKKAWADFRTHVKTAREVVDARAIMLDGDSDSWELQRLAAFGKLSKVPSIFYTEVNAARRMFYAALWDSGKIIYATNKIKKLYTPKYDKDGQPVIGTDGKPIREWDGVSFERQGFDDQEYLWQIQLRHYYDKTQGVWGIELVKCKADKSLEGLTLEGEDCNFRTLVETVYPKVPASEWGF